MSKPTFTSQVLHIVQVWGPMIMTHEVASRLSKPHSMPHQYFAKKVSNTLYRLRDQEKVQHIVCNGYVTWS